MARPPHCFVMPHDARISEQSLNSVFSVEVTLHHLMPGGEDSDEVRLQYYTRTLQVKLSPPKDPAAAAKKLVNAEKKGKSVTIDEDSGRNSGTRNSTGFVIAQNSNTLRILTCAHSIAECYAAGHHDLTVEDVNLFYHFDVTCPHQELSIHSQLGNKEISEQLRLKTPAWCIALDTAKDLMALEVDVDQIYRWCTEKWGIKCKILHNAIDMARGNPTRLERCILQGWPAQCIESVETGQLGFCNRTYPAISDENPKGYNMKLTEFTGMTAVGGCAGGPVIDGNTECLGVYHGVINKVKGYAVSAAEVYDFLHNNGVLFVPAEAMRGRLNRGCLEVKIRWVGLSTSTWEPLEEFKQQYPEFQVAEDLFRKEGGKVVDVFYGCTFKRKLFKRKLPD